MSHTLEFLYRNMNPSKVLSEYVRSKIESRLQGPGYSDLVCKLTFMPQGSKFCIKVNLRSPDGWEAHFESEGQDGRAAADLLLDKMCLAVKRHFQSLRSRKGLPKLAVVTEILGGFHEPEEAIDAEDILKFEAARQKLRRKA